MNLRPLLGPSFAVLFLLAVGVRLNGFPNEDKLTKEQRAVIKALVNNRNYTHPENSYLIRIEKMKDDTLINPVVIRMNGEKVGSVIVSDSMKVVFKGKDKMYLLFDRAKAYASSGSYGELANDMIELDLP